jgi:hypothetical protein
LVARALQIAVDGVARNLDAARVADDGQAAAKLVVQNLEARAVAG